MPDHLPWYRNNRTLTLLLPFVIIVAAISQLSLTGRAKDLGLILSIVLLLGFVVLVSTNVAKGRR
ncbi:hypothetical protein [Cellulomonas chengniuliangii]|uniref:Uncharacterized protein n=1 Tax=Cellulomonas chengniuliangii TaxID=2968084 RepID=A0ABY5L3M6_9CELL|nr:hypothetical protein [Cellulomonas chengniuliangii]MCC2308121.1 hypothetical protein [Cellulomonas chengniuliangii]MCC2317129.1 hypothetical protein [Cellulomonas chengniuliangii]UUI76515.1 hypothetical protein NP064_06415 [Cellulomonas chengniuliangii]